MTDASRLYERLTDAISPSLVGSSDLVEMLTLALLARGHVILSGMPGIAETTAVSLFARSLGLDLRQVHVTQDMQPIDLVGEEGSPGDDGRGKGPIFTNVLLVNEINRAPPRTQSALVGALDELQVTVGGGPVGLPQPFIAIATLNPVETDGLYGLPANHRDRFMFQLRMDALDFEDSLELLERYDRDEALGAPEVEPVAGPGQVMEIRKAVGSVHANTEIKEYLVEVVVAVREHPDVEYGPSSRGSLLFLRASKARAAVYGREYVIPDDVKAIAVMTLSPRLVLTTEAEVSEVDPEAVVGEALESVDPPGTAFDDPDVDLPGADGHEVD